MFKSRFGPITLVTISFLAIFLLNASPFRQDDGDEINGDLLDVGDVAVQGMPSGDGNCEFDGFLISTTGSQDETNQWLSLTLDETCRLIVDAKWAGELEDGPPSIVDPLIGALQYQTADVEETSASDASTNEFAGFSAAVTCKSSQQLVYMYGGGGPLIDRLTKKWGTLHFCYTGTSATISTHSGSCGGTNPPGAWSWVVISCSTLSVSPGPASSVQKQSRGTYRCTPIAIIPCNLSSPDGYNHTLTEKITGSGTGASSCTFGYTGQIVVSVNHQILQGCN